MSDSCFSRKDYVALLHDFSPYKDFGEEQIRRLVRGLDEMDGVTFRDLKDIIEYAIFSIDVVGKTRHLLTLGESIVSLSRKGKDRLLDLFSTSSSTMPYGLFQRLIWCVPGEGLKVALKYHSVSDYLYEIVDLVVKYALLDSNCIFDAAHVREFTESNKDDSLTSSEGYLDRVEKTLRETWAGRVLRLFLESCNYLVVLMGRGHITKNEFKELICMLGQPLIAEASRGMLSLNYFVELADEISQLSPEIFDKKEAEQLFSAVVTECLGKLSSKARVAEYYTRLDINLCARYLDTCPAALVAFAPYLDEYDREFVQTTTLSSLSAAAARAALYHVDVVLEGIKDSDSVWERDLVATRNLLLSRINNNDAS